MIPPLVFIADRVVKAVFVARFEVGESLAVIPGVFHLTRVENTGAAFGFLSGSVGLLVLFSLVCVAFLFKFVLSRGTPPYLAAVFSLVLGGALGNLYDRLRFGHVVDYLDFRVWPVFNLADVAITAGAALAVLYLLKNRGEVRA